jgi:hypothetical protein
MNPYVEFGIGRSGAPGAGAVEEIIDGLAALVTLCSNWIYSDR